MTQPIDLAAVDARIDAQLDESIELLKRLCRQPSVAAQGLGMRECAELVAATFEAMGFSARLIESAGLAAGGVSGGGFPVVYAEAPGRRAESTILCYNHYDVQPAEPLDLWESPPFDPQVRDGALYGRGVGDDKGHIVCRLAALRALRDVAGDFPCRVKFVIEGEEEIGSVHLATFVEQQRDLLRADGCLWEFGGVDYDGRPEIYLGMRGIMYVELSVRTASTDAHSGLGGSIFPNAAWRLVWALSTLKGADERIAIPGFYDDVVPASERDLALLAGVPSREADLQRSYDLPGFLLGATGLEFKRRAVFEPTCTICGLTAGYQGPGSKTVLPAAASAKVDFRLVPNQDPTDIVQKLRRHLDARGFTDVAITQLGGEHPARVDPDDPFVRLCIETAREVYGRDPVVLPIHGGSGPMHPFTHTLGLPIGVAGIGYPDSRAHAPNENIRLRDFALGVKHTARIFARFAEG